MKKIFTKRRIITAVAILLLIATSVTCSIMFYRVPIVYDIEGIESVKNNVVKLAAKSENNPTSFTSLVKMENGVILDEEFKIIMFTDLHICELKERTAQTVDAMVKAVQKERPDLVIITGDLMNGLNNHKRVKQFGEIMEKLGVYWAPILGNHEGDRKLLMSRERTVEVWAGFEHCLIEAGTKTTKGGEAVWGYGNYAFNILNGYGKIVKSFVMLDGGNKVGKDDAIKYNVSEKSSDFIKKSQIDWYIETVARLTAENGTTAPHMLCVHIPLPEYKCSINFDEENRKITSASVGWELLYGGAIEEVTSSEYNSGMYEALVSNGAEAVFCGHDHLIDFTVYNREDDIYLIYLRNSTYSSYDIITKGISDNPLDRLQGYNVLDIKSDGEFTLSSYTNVSEKTDIIIG